MIAPDLQIDWLRTFVAVVDSGSLTAAARTVYRSQSAVSMQLKKLEDAVGRPLLTRSVKGHSLTPAGFELLVHARKMMDVHAAAVQALHGLGVAGRVAFGVSDDYAASHMMPVLRSFGTRYPDIDVTLTCEPSVALLSQLDRGEIDLAVVTRDTPDRGDLLFRESLIWVASEQHEAWTRNPVPVAIHGIDSRLRSEMIAAMTVKQRSFRVAYHSPNLAGQIVAAESGLAVAVITRGSLPPGLKVVDERQELPPLRDIEVALVRSRESERSEAIAAMREHILQAFDGAQTGR